MRLIQALLGPAVLLISFSAYAKCQHPPTAWQFGQPFVATWRTDGAVCTSTSNHPENIAEIKVTEKPKHGIAGRNGPHGIAYRPTPGFKGSDSFVYTVTSNANYRKGPGLVAHVTINVVVE
ncbi:MAG TPA: Ig-like domain-containing protein [Bradyrhizobium sp.]|nr:Ig-like domain-containing protein [Bradyrhizobium sp.]